MAEEKRNQKREGKVSGIVHKVHDAITPEHPHYNHLHRTFGQKLADNITVFGGSWTFMLILISTLILWVTLNLVAWVNHWDPYPFILLNLFLSCLAAFQAPIILMSQNRQTERDRAKAERDYAVNRKAEREIADIQKDLEQIKELIREK